MRSLYQCWKAWRRKRHYKEWNEWFQSLQAAVAFRKCAYCDQCGAPVVPHDALYCLACGVMLYAPTTGPQPVLHPPPPLQQQPPPERTTEKMVLHVPPGTLVRSYSQASGGVHTKLIAAISKAQVAELIARQQQHKVS